MIKTNLSIKQLTEKVKSLSERQREALLLIMAGYRYNDIANKLDISNNAVNKLLYACRQKMSATTLCHCTALAIRGGILESHKAAQSNTTS